MRVSLQVLLQLADSGSLVAQLLPNRLLGFGSANQLATDPGVFGGGRLVVFRGRGLFHRRLGGTILHLASLLRRAKAAGGGIGEPFIGQSQIAIELSEFYPERRNA